MININGVERCGSFVGGSSQPMRHCMYLRRVAGAAGALGVIVLTYTPCPTQREDD